MRKIRAYIKKSALNLVSYRFAFALSIFAPIISVVIFFFIDKLFGSQIAPHLAPFGINYFSYVLVGIMAGGFLGGTISALAAQLNDEQMMGTFEALISTPTGIYTIMIAMMSWNFILSIFNIFIYVIAGIFIFGVDFGNINLVSTAVILLISIISFNALGMLSASFIIAFKRGDPVSYLMNIGMEVLGGVFFPITVLPEWVRIFSYIFPITYSIRSLEKAVYQGAALAILWQDVLILLCISLALIPIASIAIKASLSYARRKGTLVQY
ncbi:MAG: ABC transporter permease [Planctomycetes bacterium]|nr:ABC transporter permease [Planctomycetota bacterium]